MTKSGKTPTDARKVNVLERIVERGTVFALDGKPYVVTRIGDDGTGGDSSTINYAAIEDDGFAHREHWINPWVLESALREGKAQFIDGACARLHTTLPEDWKARVDTYYAQVRAEASKRIAEGRDPLHDKEPVAHPSFGMVRLSRAHGGHGHLFGSPFQHSTRIDIDVYRATERRHLSNTRQSQEGIPLVSFSMSEAQFAQFITSVAVGDGTPCTLGYVWGQRMPAPPATDEVEEFHKDTRRTLSQAGLRVREATEKVQALLDKPTVTKADRRAVLDLLTEVSKAFDDSLPFTVEQFHERVEKILAAGKLEIEAYIARRRDAGALPSGEAPVTLALGAKKEES